MMQEMLEIQCYLMLLKEKEHAHTPHTHTEYDRMPSEPKSQSLLQPVFHLISTLPKSHYKAFEKPL